MHDDRAYSLSCFWMMRMVSTICARKSRLSIWLPPILRTWMGEEDFDMMFYRGMKEGFVGDVGERVLGVGYWMLK